MKTIILVCLASLFTSCGKLDIRFDLGDEPIYFNWSYIILDSNSKVKTDVIINGSENPFRSKKAAINKTVWSGGDSSSIKIYAVDSLNSLTIQMKNTLALGNYQFGSIPGRRESISAILRIGNKEYYNNPDQLQGLLTIDSLTSTGIKGSFNFICRNGGQAAFALNGSFSGILR